MKSRTNLIFYYPLNENAPSSVARSIFDNLLKKSSSLPFDTISIFCSSNDESALKSKFKNLTIYTEKNITKMPDSIIHIPISPHIFPNAKFLLHIYSKLKRYPLIFNYHGDIRTEVRFNYKNNHHLSYSYVPTYLFLPVMLRSSSILIVHSYLFQSLVTKKYGVSNAIVIPNAIEDYWYLPEHELINKKEDFLEIFYHGRLSSEKGIDILIKGFNKFLRKFKHKAILYIAGEGPQRQYLENLAKSLEVDENVVFLGNLDKSVIKGYLKKVDGAIYPSMWDNFPLSFMEAFACANCPVYFSKRAGIYDFVKKDNTVMLSFEPNIDMICNIINNLSERKTNPIIIEYQKEFSSKYRWEYVVDSYIDVYSQLCQTMK